MIKRRTFDNICIWSFQAVTGPVALRLLRRLSYAGDLRLGEGVKGGGIESGGGGKTVNLPQN